MDTEMMKGNHVLHEMDTTNTILDIKKKLYETEGVEPEQLKLMCNGKVLTGDMTLETVKTAAGGNDVKLVARERMHVNVTTPHG